jgi:hypothetical protein
MGANTMTHGKRIVTGSFGVLLSLAATAVGGPQETPSKDKSSPASGKSVPSPSDSKMIQDAKARVAAAAFLESAYDGKRPPEAVRMLAAILRGSKMGPGEGWFGPAETRYSWRWLAKRYGVDPAQGGISRARFGGRATWFARLDRNRDGEITEDDLDWSDRNPYVQMSYLASRLFRKLNERGNGHLTKDELVQFFEKAAQGKGYLSSDDFRDALLAGWTSSSRPGDVPSPALLIRGVFAGELGSMSEGPKLNEPAPDFTLKTVDGKATIQLAKLVRSKPVVLAFGSFT